MALRRIVKFPDPFLRKPTLAVEVFDDEIRQLVADMGETMYATHGAGIAAIQVGDLRRIFLVEATVAGGTEDEPPVAFVNPKIEWLSSEIENSEEGCLSFPSIYVPVKRALRARVSAQDVSGAWFTAEGEGLYARAMQHEHDHLIGRLLIDQVGPIKKQMIKRKLEKAARIEAEEGAYDDDGGDDEGAEAAAK